jgi:hypothetical protein
LKRRNNEKRKVAMQIETTTTVSLSRDGDLSIMSTDVNNQLTAGS